MLELTKDRILKLLKSRQYRPVKLAKFARTLGISNEDYPAFKEAFAELRNRGHVVIGTGNLVTLPPMSGRVIGTFRANRKGFGFVVPLEANSHGDLFIGAKDTGGAMTGDIVAAKIAKKGKRGGQMRYSGSIVEILERANDRFVGTLIKERSGWRVQPDGKSFTEPVTVEDISAKGAKEKDKVVVEILSYPSGEHSARGVIVEVLGRAGRYETEIASIIHQFRLPEAFDDDCHNHARKLADGFDAEQVVGREDLTDKTIITIDPPDAKDFDDAISLEKDAKGQWVLGVHIADVSSLVQSGTELDVEARNRGNSVYLPQRTIPMLPEILSNGICSLQPNQRRFAKSVFITYESDGKIVDRRFANAVIKSSTRLTYLQADRICKGHTKDFPPEVIELMRNMERLSRIIERRRKTAGMLHLDLPETELEFDSAGQVIGAHPAENSYPHTIIEMFMVEANEAVAAFLDRKGESFVRRIHPEPDAMSLKNLAKLVRSLGLNMPRNPDRFDVQGILESVQGKDSSFAVSMAVLRSFEKAVYSPADMGHYALAGRHYCHFTSPIRRYADLLVHRQLDGHLRNSQSDALDDSALAETAKHITFTEQRAEDAERELKAVLILQVLKSRLGDELDGVVTGLASFGLFVRCQKFGIEGLIPLEDLGPDKWSYNEKGYCVIGQNTGLSIQLGYRIKARIVSVNVAARQLNLTPAEPLVGKGSPGKSKGKKKPPKKRAAGRRRR